MIYEVVLAPSGRRHLNQLPEAVAAAVIELIYADLASSPRRVGKPLSAPFDGRHVARRGQYRITYRIDDRAGTVTVLTIRHRRDAYRS